MVGELAAADASDGTDAEQLSSVDVVFEAFWILRVALVSVDFAQLTVVLTAEADESELLLLDVMFGAVCESGVGAAPPAALFFSTV